MSFEYIWIDNNNKLRSKTKRDARINPLRKDPITNKTWLSKAGLPEWNCDGSSCGLAGNDATDVILKPQAVFKDPFRRDGESYLVLCDCYDANNKPVDSNTRYRACGIFYNKQVRYAKPWFGLEQEYVIYDNKTGRPYGWDKYDPKEQGQYYCGVGSQNSFGRKIVDKHYEYCLYAGVKISGINSEVMPSQWEFQVGPCEGIELGDHMWIARYIYERISEKYDVTISYDPKPEEGWNGSGCHTNFSTLLMRRDIKHIHDGIAKLADKHKEHLAVYGNNEKRLSGKYETSDPNTFTWGVSDRSASIRIPINVDKGGKGYLEDRRPASDCDPYVVSSIIAQTVIL